MKTNPDGTIVFESATELKGEMSNVAKEAIDAAVKEGKLNQPSNLSSIFGGSKLDQRLIEVFEGLPGVAETRVQRQKRIDAAVTEVRGMKLRYEDAPKEVKMMAFCRAMAEKNTEVVKALSEGSATDGGNLVPIEFGTDLKVAIEQYTAIRDCTQNQMTTNELDLRSVTTKPIIYQVGELVAVTESGTKFDKPILQAKAFAGLQIMSKELFQDNNVGLYDKLVNLFAEGFAARQSLELFKGTTFTGIFGSTTPQVTTGASSSINDITYKELVKMVNSLSPGQLSNGGRWYMHRNIWAIIQSITDDNNRPIVLNPWDVRNRTLLGYPVTLDEQIPFADAADTAFIAFGNLMWVDFGMRQEIASSILTEGTVATINLAEKRALGLIIDTRWGLTVSLPGNLAIYKTKA